MCKYIRMRGALVVGPRSRRLQRWRYHAHIALTAMTLPCAGDLDYARKLVTKVQRGEHSAQTPIQQQAFALRGWIDASIRQPRSKEEVCFLQESIRCNFPYNKQNAHPCLLSQSKATPSPHPERLLHTRPWQKRSKRHNDTQFLIVLHLEQQRYCSRDRESGMV